MNPTKKTVGLVTWLGAGNFGTALQSYALHEKLRSIGYNIYYLQPFSHLNPLKGIIKTTLEKSGLQGLKSRISIASKTLKEKKLFKFQKEKYNIEKVYTPGQHNKLLAKTDVFVTGSDQIWNTKHEFNPFMFLNFAGEVKRIAYASSIGTSSVPDEHKKSMKELLSKFKYIGVREQTAVTVLQEIVGRNDIRQVLDPTFLLSAEEWRNLGREAKIEISIPDRYILCYLIGNNEWYRRQLEDVKQKTGISNVVIIPAAENPTFASSNAIIYKAADPAAFINLIENASLVCTDSFHATTLSINLSRNFVEFLRFSDVDYASQNSRIYDLLEYFGLNTRMYNSESNAWTKTIEYQEVQKILDRGRRSSLDYLINAIEN